MHSANDSLLMHTASFALCMQLRKQYVEELRNELERSGTLFDGDISSEKVLHSKFMTRKELLCVEATKDSEVSVRRTLLMFPCAMRYALCATTNPMYHANTHNTASMIASRPKGAHYTCLAPHPSTDSADTLQATWTALLHHFQVH